MKTLTFIFSFLLFLSISANGQVAQQWRIAYKAPGQTSSGSGEMVLFDEFSNVYVTGGYNGSSLTRGITLKINSNGSINWSNVFVPTINISNTWNYAIALDASGNIVTGGSTNGYNGTSDGLIIDYTNSGNQQWARNYNGAFNSGDGISSIKCDNLGNVYAVGNTTISSNNSDYLLLKYSNSGNLIWSRTYDGGANGNDIINSIWIDNLSNVYVTGNSYNSSGNNDAVTIKYDSSGNQIWLTRYNTIGTNSESGMFVKGDIFNNIFVTGIESGGVFICKYSSTGSLLWNRSITGVSYADGRSTLDIDTSGNVFIGCKQTPGPNGGWDFVIVKYNPSGTQQWLKYYGGPGNGSDKNDLLNSIAVDVAGNSFVTGWSDRPGKPVSAIVVKHDALGNFQWVYADDSSFTISNSLSINNKGEIAISGFNYTTGSILVTKLLQTPYTPNLVLPTNNSTNIPVNQSFKWNRTSAATYRLQIATDVSFNNLIVNDSTLTDSLKVVTGLNNNTTYYWRVNAKNAAGTSGYSSIWNFTTILPVPSAPSLLSPLNNSIGNQLSLNLVWSKPQYASGYRIILATDNAFSNIIINDSTLTDSLKSLSGLNPMTYYWWKVQAKNAAGWGNYSSAYSFKTLGTPTTVNLLQPNNNAVNQPVTLTFMWSKAIDQTFSIKSSELKVLNERKENKKSVSGDSPNSVSKYWFELTTDTSSFANLLRDTTLTDTTKNVAALSNSTGYFWRVKAKNEIGWGSFTYWFKFTTIIATPNVPILVSPLHHSFGNEITSLNLVWRKPASAVSYRLQLATDSMFNNVVFNDSTLTDTVKNFTNLLPLTYYYWRVNSKNIGGTSGYSYPWMFKTKGSPNNVTLINPPNNAVNQPISIAFKWNLPTEQTFARGIIKGGRKVFGDNPNSIQKYWFELTTDTVSLSNLQRDTLLTDTSKLVTGLTNLTNYWWRVKAKNEAGWGMFGGWFKLTTITANPTVPLLYSPQNNALNISLNTTLVWYKLSNAASYNLLLAKDSLFTNIIVNDSTLTDSIKAVTNLDTSTVYFWKVRAKNIGGYGAFGSVWNFKTVPLPPNAPNLISPLNGSTNQPQSALFDWDSLTTAVNYRLRVATDSLFTNTILDTSTVNSSFRAYTNLLNLNVKYYWKVNASNPGGTGQYSSVWSFTTTAVGIINISQTLPKEYKLYNNYPNPFNPSTRIKFDVPKSANVNLVVYDITGKEVARLVNGQLQAGTYEYEWNAATFASGVYFCRLESNEYTKIMRVMLIK